MDSRPWLNYSIHTPTTPTPNNVARKTRKPYTLTKEKEYWTDLEHDKFVEAVELFGRDWRKIAAFVGKKTAKQINSHAQKHFKKIKKDGTNEYIPPPRPKKKAAHPYPRKAIQNG
ncbi:hypothetical protein IFM89_039415 [Coptis chinensis]|uniref:Uncharacterized protein n=1 Tax=Coptis chinensis TaxID=261450 RepID=A0A835IK32_9MAGN|nr:hypothetical protein IFM89_039415 [Coptis chinensis]